MKQPNDESVDPDAVIVRQAVQGDPAALDQLARRYRAAALSIAYGWTKNLADAEDLTQEILAQAVGRISELRDAAAFGGWLRMIATNRCRVWYRSRSDAALRLEEVEEPASGEPTPHAALEQTEARQTTIDLLDLLSDGVALAARLHYVDGLSAPQIASALDLPIPTIEGRLYRARARFRSALEETASDSRIKALLLKLITLNEGGAKMDSIRIEIGSDFFPFVGMEPPNLISAIRDLRSSLEADAEFVMPAVRICDGKGFSPLQYRILVHEVAVVNGEAQEGQSAVAEAVDALRETALNHRAELSP